MEGWSGMKWRALTFIAKILREPSDDERRATWYQLRRKQFFISSFLKPERRKKKRRSSLFFVQQFDHHCVTSPSSSSPSSASTWHGTAWQQTENVTKADLVPNTSWWQSWNEKKREYSSSSSSSIRWLSHSDFSPGLESAETQVEEIFLASYITNQPTIQLVIQPARNTWASGEDILRLVSEGSWKPNVNLGAYQARGQAGRRTSRARVTTFTYFWVFSIFALRLASNLLIMWEWIWIVGCCFRVLTRFW